jgi:hypothetical protein
VRFSASAEACVSPQAFGNQGRPVAAASLPPAANKHRQIGPRRHEAERHIGAVQVATDKFSHSFLHHEHFCPQGADLPLYFVESVVHGLLEQKENI